MTKKYVSLLLCLIKNTMSLKRYYVYEQALGKEL